MNSPDSWIDLSEVAELLRQLKPGPSNLEEEESNGEAAPTPLVDDSRPIFRVVRPAHDHPAVGGMEDVALPSEDPVDARLDANGASTPVRSAIALRQRANEALDQLKRFADHGTPPPASNSNGSSSGFAPSISPPEPRGRLRHRLESYASWVREVTGASELFITDSQGYSLLDDDRQENAPAVGASLQLIQVLEQVRQRMNAAGPNSGVYLPLGEDKWFGVLECVSTAGEVCVGMVTRAPLSAAAAEQLVSVLRQSLESVPAN